MARQSMRHRRQRQQLQVFILRRINGYEFAVHHAMPDRLPRRELVARNYAFGNERAQYARGAHLR